MKFSDLCINRPIFACMMNLMLVLAGALSLEKLPVRELPDVDPPIVSVSTLYPGASAQIIESEVTEKLEEILSTIEGIKTISSTSSDSSSQIVLEFELSREINEAAQEVRDRVARVRNDLPEDVEEPIVSKQDADAQPMLWVALYSDQYSTQDLSHLARTTLKDKLQMLDGVSSVLLGGEKKLAIRVRLDPFKMASLGTTLLDVQRALAEQNIQLPSGRVEGHDRELSIEAKWQLANAKAFEEIVVSQLADKRVTLADIATLEEGAEDERSVARYNSKAAVGLGVVKQAKANTISVAQLVKARMQELSKQMPAGINYSVAYDESIFVEKAIHEVWETLFIAFILVVGVIYLFLGNLRSTLIPSLTIPVCLVGTFALMAGLGFTVNIVTMLALVLAIGIVVDDSIVVLENTYRYIEEGDDPKTAARKGVGEVAFAVIATTVVLAAVFVPLAIQSSVSGRLFREFALVLIGSIVISAFVALTLTPALCAILLAPKSAQKEESAVNKISLIEPLKRLQLKYNKLLEKLIGRPRFSWLLVFISLSISAIVYLRLPSEFIPAEDKGRFMCLSFGPEGATPAATDEVVSVMESIIQKTPGVEGYFSAVALSGDGPGKGNQGLVFVRLAEENRPAVTDLLAGPKGLMASFWQKIPQALAIPILPKSAGGMSQDFQMVLHGSDLKELSQVSTLMIEELRATGYFSNLRPSFNLDKPQINLLVDREQATRLQVPLIDVARTLQVLFGGMDLSRIQREGREYEVIAQMSSAWRLNAQSIHQIYVRSQAGNLVPLSQIVDYSESGGPNQIQRWARERSCVIEATPIGKTLGDAMQEASLIAQRILPATMSYEWAGESRNVAENTSSMLWVIILAMIVVYMTLSAQFESLIDPLIVMIAVPLAGAGALLSLWILSHVHVLGSLLYALNHFLPEPPLWASWLNWIPRIPGMNINLYSQIGMLLLIGLVVKNSILIVEFANQLHERGLDWKEAAFRGASLRLRPILMTSLATILGILPIVISTAAGSESRRPMGISILGGLSLSTVLTVLLLPAVYYSMKRMSERTKS